ncbi:MAG: hypothetical protein IPK76_13020 [Lewinellaceae bacterium]|nr:hypothetical protein [Lewinellaceae bacterium]
MEKMPQIHLEENQRIEYNLNPDAAFLPISIERAYETINNPGASRKWIRRFEEFEECLFEELHRTTIGFQIISYYPQVRDRLRQEAEKREKLTWQEYSAICREYDPEVDLDLLTIYLHDITGTILHFPNIASLKDTVFIDINNAVHERIYKVLNYDVKNNNGVFNLDHVCKTLKCALDEAEEFIKLLGRLRLVFHDEFKCLYRPSISAQTIFKSDRTGANFAPFRFRNSHPFAIPAFHASLCNIQFHCNSGSFGT